MERWLKTANIQKKVVLIYMVTIAQCVFGYRSC
jgi:hypothetical protein